MSLWDWIGPTSLSKRRGWDALPSAPTEQKAQSWTLPDSGAALTVRTLVHGPGATELLNGWRGNDANSAVFACLQAIATAIAEPELTVYKIQPGERVEQEGSPLGDLLRRPNPHLSMDTLLWYLSNCLKVDGNAYWRKLRAGNEETGNVVELWPISPCRIEPHTQSGSGDFVSFYRYWLRPGKYEDISPANIVHHRVGLDDKDHRLGLAALKRLAREVSSDDQATRWADRLLANFATPGLSLEFPPDRDPITQPDAEMMKDRIQSAYGGDNVGAVSVLSPGAKLVSHGFSPEQMDMKTLHRVPEERISAVLGVPAIVAGLGAGLDRSTFANVREAREMFTEMTLIPMWRAIGATITMSLVPDFTSDASTVVDFDITEVRALSDDEDKKATRLSVYVGAGILDIDEARAEIGREPKATQPALPAPAKLRALPAKSRPVETKALDDLPGEFDDLKAEAEPMWQDAIETFLSAQLSRIAQRLRAGGDTAEGLVVEGEATLLGETLQPLQTAALADVHRLVVAELGIAFDLDDAQTRSFLTSAGQNIVGITDHTRDAVRAALIEGQQAGEGIPQLAARLRSLPAFNRARAITVSRTELGHAQIEAAYQSYRASGVVVGIRIHDGDYDSACASRNGTVLSLDAAAGAPRLLHPRCTAAWAPIVDASELTRSA